MNTSIQLDADADRSWRTLQRDSERVLRRGWGLDAAGQRSSVLLVSPANEQPLPATLDRLAHECRLKDELDGAWAVRPLELRRAYGQTMLVLEDPGGEPLDRLFGAPMPLEAFLPLAIGMATALTGMHQRGLIHKDIKPANIFVNCANGEVRLTGFGIASRLARERQTPEPPETIAGSLAYMAPEQTGRMNRSIDSRSDLYSLGVTLYQLLTGELPFTATEPMEWVHCHIARKPSAPSGRFATVPVQVSNIVMKLLEKTAEERYQTAAGVQRDLRRCLTEWQTTHSIDEFPLGERDTPDRLVIPEKLYGREKEVDTLLASFDRVVAGSRPELVLVSGYSGIGKSSVVNELHKSLVPPRGLFASGKFDQYKRDIPYSTLAQAFRSLIHPLLSKSDTELARWRNALRDAVGSSGKLVVDLIPELKLIIGEQPPVVELPPRDAQLRFQLVFRRFIAVFARAEHPLALFLDDLQWLDTATLDLLEHLLGRTDMQHLMLIGAYRDNEVNPAHPLMRKLEAIRQAGAKVHEIVLAPLAHEDLEQLIRDSLRCDPSLSISLAKLLHEKTGGNPFFAIQFLSSLADERLLTFDHVDARWSWDLKQIHAKGYTDNVVDLMVAKLSRLPVDTQTALQRFACLGNSAAFGMLSMIFQNGEEEMHDRLWEAVRAGLVFRSDEFYRFLHDRVQEGAYSLIPDESRSETHLRIGRLLSTKIPSEKREEAIFEIVNQLNLGFELITSVEEREELAELNLIAGKRAKASTAYASACKYLSFAMFLLGERRWDSRYELAFAIWFERAECEFLDGKLEEAERLITQLLARSVSRIDNASICRLRIDLYVMKSEYTNAVNCALECLRLFGIDMPLHPSAEEVQAEYAEVWKNLNGRSIESLVDLPLMTDPEMLAAMNVLSSLTAPAIFTNNELHRLHTCRMVRLTLQHGTSGAATHSYAGFGTMLGPHFRRYPEGYRFGKLACDLVEKHGFAEYKARMCLTMEMIVLWNEPIATALDYIREAFRVATETSDLARACYSCNHTVTDRLTRGDPLDEVREETERGLDFVRKGKFRDVEDILVSQQRFIRTMRGETTTFSTFSDQAFDEAAFEAALNGDRMSALICWYWILKLQARFFSGDYEVAIAAAEKAKALLWSSDAHIQLLDYYLYSSLAVAAVYESAAPDQQTIWRALLATHVEQLRDWTENCPTTFGDKHAVVSAEIARIEGRDLDAMHHYEEAIRLAHTNGFVHNEAVAYELAARFYDARRFDKIADTYLRAARYCYVCWGATGKVRQLDSLYPHLQEKEAVGPASTIGTSVEQLDLATVIRVSRAVSGEMMLDKLLNTLMRTAIEQAGAARGLLILARRGEPRIKAQASIDGDTVTVQVRDAPVTAAMLPAAVLHYVMRTRESVILDDALNDDPFQADPYIRQHRVRSVLSLPLINQGELIGVLYLENNLTPSVFVAARIAVLKLLASQAAMALENSRLYGDLAEREAKIRRLVDANIVGIFIFDLDGRIFEANDAFLHIVGYEREDLTSGRLRWTELTPPESLERDKREWMPQYLATGTLPPFEKEYFKKDRSRVPVLIGAASLEGKGNQGVAFVLDLTERKQAEAEAHESERRYREVQMMLAHANRVTTMGHLAASICHEIKQPITADATNAQAGLCWLSARPPNLQEARKAFNRIIESAMRAGEIATRIRGLVKNAPPCKEKLQVNDAIGEVIALTRGEAEKHNVSVRMQLADQLPLVEGDRVQLQQVMLNLVVNAIEATSTVDRGPREVTVSTCKDGSGSVLVAVLDSGPGVDPQHVERLFEAFYTTKAAGMGMGLAICRSIVEAHGGRIWVSATAPHGAAFRFTVPVQSDNAQ
ncbi:trifunctional serine/threonine-protein kinase/ATP-binding protein/sensor histidine kinase [Paraburkholderia rhizosphaerae]|uniref:histidine kinase n=1 Tax=Paraburkholderia rhizosphaerae TaxID=480658 RepID=A0A4V3HDD4_9BURK|nr:trifunctional serine/threonine-protein kinase/ATP-binding protein/sensor histidine kinase [Paraburkholderia rhizosphaerae]TDY40574.1 PAS domain S-box-containing protein [Paraburkholderia rhizosphaerae]